MTFDLEKMRRNRDAGTPGRWFSLPMNGPRLETNFARVFAADDDLRYIADCRDSMNFHSKTDNEANAARIAMVPDMEAEIERLTAERDSLAEALRPFSEEASWWFTRNYDASDTPVEGFADYEGVMTCGDLFRARAELAKLEKNDE